MKKTIGCFTLLIVIVSQIYAGKVYYVDASSGNDRNNGLSPGAAWKTIDKVNSKKFLPGDRILFKRGQIWRKQLIVPTSGTAGDPITYSSYGEGNRPIMSGRLNLKGWKTKANWTNEGNRVWSFYLDTDPLRLFLDGNEYVESDAVKNINDKERWFHSSGRLYVFAPRNPASFYTRIQGSRTSFSYVIFLNKKDHIILDDLEIRGAQFSVYCFGSDYITIDNCKAGLYAGQAGISVEGDNEYPFTPSRYGEVMNCHVESGYKNAEFDHNTLKALDGIGLRGGVQYWKVHDNIVSNWGHTCIVLSNTDINQRCTGNEVYNNEMFAPNTNYCRGIDFGAGKADNMCDRNKVYQNHIHHITVRNQIHGNHNEFFFNVIDTVVTGKKSAGVADIADGIALFSAQGQKCHDNKIYNNLIYNTADNGIKLYGWTGWGTKENNVIRNNIIMNWGDSAYGIYIGGHYSIKGNVYENNLIYKPFTPFSIHYRGVDKTVKQFDAEDGNNNDVIKNNYTFPLFWIEH